MDRKNTHCGKLSSLRCDISRKRTGSLHPTSRGVNVAPESANHMVYVSLNGILQKPGSSFTISGSTMTFALESGDRGCHRLRSNIR